MLYDYFDIFPFSFSHTNFNLRRGRARKNVDRMSTSCSNVLNKIESVLVVICQRFTYSLIIPLTRVIMVLLGRC